MKKRKSITAAVIIATASIVGMTPTTASAQNVSESITEGMAAMRKQEWIKAHSLFSAVVGQLGERGQGLFGGKFGVIYYNKGVCELKIGRDLIGKGGEENVAKGSEFLTMAVESFKKCREIPSDERSKNPFFNKSLLYLGQSLQALQEFPEAIKTYKKFLEVRDPENDKYNIGMFHINMAICHFKLEDPDLAEGSKYYTNALQNKDKWRVPDPAIVTAFKDFASAAIAKNKEQVLVDFINENRAAITLDPFKMYQFTPFFRKYGSEAFEKNMIKGAFSLYALMPGTIETKDDLEARKKTVIGYKRDILRDMQFNKNDVVSAEQIKRDQTHVKAQYKSGDPHELLALRQFAYTHESEGYTRGAFGAYELLELYHNDSKDREDNLFNLVRTASLISEVMETEKYGRRFLELYPESKYKEQVKSMMLISLFYSGEYEVALKVSEELLPTTPENTPPHDLCLHVYGGSLYYLGRFFDAHPHIVKHLKMYPKSEYKIATRFFEASNLSRLEDWEKAGVKLDKFLADFPNAGTNIYIPFALYDRGNVHFAEEEYKEAVAKLDRIEKEFPASAVEDMAYNLRGDVHNAAGERKEAEAYHNKALALAKLKNNTIVSGEALYKLVALLGIEKIGKEENPDLARAVVPYDEFWKDFQDSPYKTQVAAAGVPALRKVGRGEEGLANLQGVISELAAQTNAPGMERAINTYGKYFLEAGNTPEQLKAHFESFPGIDAGNKRAQALLRIAVIGVYEDLLAVATKKKDEAQMGIYQSRIDAMFKDMNARYQLDELSDFILIRLGNFVSEKSDPTKALGYYDQIIKNGRAEFKTMAQFGRARILAVSSNPAKQNDAKKTLIEVRDDKNSNKKTKDSSTYQLCKLYAKQGNWAMVVKECSLYGEKRYPTKKPEVALLLATAFEKTGDFKKAIGAYNSTYSRYKASWAISIPALTRASQLTWQHGAEVKGVSAKQIAYNPAARFLKASKKAYFENKEQMSLEEIDAYEKLQAQVKEWETLGDIQTLKEQDEARKNG